MNYFTSALILTHEHMYTSLKHGKRLFKMYLKSNTNNFTLL